MWFLWVFFNPLNPKIQNWILICCLYSFHYRSSGEKLRKYQANSSCVIMSIILMTTLFYKALILQGEIWCWSLLGLKGLNTLKYSKIGICYFFLWTGFKFCNALREVEDKIKWRERVSRSMAPQRSPWLRDRGKAQVAATDLHVVKQSNKSLGVHQLWPKLWWWPLAICINFHLLMLICKTNQGKM